MAIAPERPAAPFARAARLGLHASGSAEATRQVKSAIRTRIAASGRSVEEVFAVAEQLVRTEVEDIVAASQAGEAIWPVIDYADIASGTVPAQARTLLRRRGCLVVRGHFTRDQARAWDKDIVSYVEGNQFFENYRGPGDGFFDSIGVRPEIYPVYWSNAQMEARQSERMARVQMFLNSQWKHESDGVQWFDPGPGLAVPDRVRRPPPGTDSGGLRPHLDPGTLDLWMTEATRKLSGTCSTAQSSSTTRGTPHSARPAQVHRDDHVLGIPHVPGLDRPVRHGSRPGCSANGAIPGAMAYLMLRPLLADVPGDDMCGVSVGRAIPVTEKWHELPLRALSGLPDIQATQPGGTAT